MKIVKEITKSEKIKDLLSIKLDTFQDYRGEIWTVYSEEYTDLKFVADKITISRFGVLRGLHGDPHTAKLSLLKRANSIGDFGFKKRFRNIWKR